MEGSWHRYVQPRRVGRVEDTLLISQFDLPTNRFGSYTGADMERPQIVFIGSPSMDRLVRNGQERQAIGGAAFISALAACVSGPGQVGGTGAHKVADSVADVLIPVD